MKSLQKLADSASAKVVTLNFHAHGQTRAGYAIVDSEGNELMEIEPVYYSNGDRWKVTNRTDKVWPLRYRKSIKGIDKEEKIVPGHTGYIFKAMYPPVTMQTILEELKTKREVIFNPDTLTHEQREEIQQAIYREDIYRTITHEGKWKIWKRIFN